MKGIKSSVRGECGGGSLFINVVSQQEYFTLVLLAIYCLPLGGRWNSVHWLLNPKCFGNGFPKSPFACLSAATKVNQITYTELLLSKWEWVHGRALTSGCRHKSVSSTWNYITDGYSFMQSEAPKQASLCFYFLWPIALLPQMLLMLLGFSNCSGLKC